jgi:23S rRNA (guanosine2251-2'-O)-methyltransferase
MAKNKKKKFSTEILFGFHPVLEALKSKKRKFFEIYIAKNITKRTNQIISIAQTRNIKIFEINADQLSKLTGSDQHQAIAAKVSSYPYFQLSDILDKKKSDFEKSVFLLTDNICDPHNLGALIRSAYATGINSIIIPKNRSVTPSPLVSKVSAGALEHIKIIMVVNMATTIKEMKKNGIWIVGMDHKSNNILWNFDFIFPLAIVIGSEEKGIRPLVKSGCDFLVSIPQKGNVSSLNASVAGALVMYEAFRQTAPE